MGCNLLSIMYDYPTSLRVACLGELVVEVQKGVRGPELVESGDEYWKSLNGTERATEGRSRRYVGIFISTKCILLL